MIRQWWQRLCRPVRWHELRSTRPLSRVFGADRGQPVDRFYIEHFLASQRHLLGQQVLEVADSSYSRRFAAPEAELQVLHVQAEHPGVTLVGDLSRPETLPEAVVDSFICTQTLNFIYDLHAAIRGVHRVLRPGGVALVTLAGLCQISRYDMDRWGDYWRFTQLSAQQAFAEVFGAGQIEVGYYGNVLAATALLHGISADELTPAELLEQDEDYPVLITVVARRC